MGFFGTKPFHSLKLITRCPIRIRTLNREKKHVLCCNRNVLNIINRVTAYVLEIIDHQHTHPNGLFFLSGREKLVIASRALVLGSIALGMNRGFGFNDHDRRVATVATKINLERDPNYLGDLEETIMQVFIEQTDGAYIPHYHGPITTYDAKMHLESELMIIADFLDNPEPF